MLTSLAPVLVSSTFADASERIADLEAALKEKEAIIEAFSTASQANTEAARAAAAAAAQARADEGNVTITESEVLQIVDVLKETIEEVSTSLGY